MFIVFVGEHLVMLMTFCSADEVKVILVLNPRIQNNSTIYKKKLQNSSLHNVRRNLVTTFGVRWW